MFDSLRQSLAQIVALVHLRLELITTELAAEVQRAVRVLWMARRRAAGGRARAITNRPALTAGRLLSYFCWDHDGRCTLQAAPLWFSA